MAPNTPMSSSLICLISLVQFPCRRCTSKASRFRTFSYSQGGPRQANLTGFQFLEGNPFTLQNPEMLRVDAVRVLRQARYRDTALCQRQKALCIVLLRNLNVSYRKHQAQNRQITLLCQVINFACQRSRSSNCVAASVFSSRYFTITGAYSDRPHSRPFSVCTARAPGTTTAPAGISSGASPLRR
jgi:hypothetical protein